MVFKNIQASYNYIYTSHIYINIYNFWSPISATRNVLIWRNDVEW